MAWHGFQYVSQNEFINDINKKNKTILIYLNNFGINYHQINEINQFTKILIRFYSRCCLNFSLFCKLNRYARNNINLIVYKETEKKNHKSENANNNNNI